MAARTPIYFVYGSASRESKPLDPGTALYVRVFNKDDGWRDYRWDGVGWTDNDYIGHLLSRGEPAVDNVDESDLPEWLPKPPNEL